MSPILDIFGISVPAYMFFAVLGFSAAIMLAYFRNRNERIKWSAYFLFIVFAVIGMLIGSKTLFFITMLPSVFEDFSFYNFVATFISSGFVFYGGLMGAIGGGALSAKILKTDRHTAFSVFIPPIVLFHTFGRLGCFFAGCCYGIEFPIGFSYPSEHGIIRFPVQLAEAFGNIIIILLLLLWEHRNKEKADMLSSYLLLYAPMRFILEFMRGDSIRGHLWLLSTSQWISLLIVTVVIIVKLKNKKKLLVV